MSEHLATSSSTTTNATRANGTPTGAPSPWVDRPWIDLFAGLSAAGGALLDLGCGGGDSVATSLTAHGMKLTDFGHPAIVSEAGER
jgi:2-polyprenyl-3-methyl-5-hydroxy-6-metoxy-1,4-benzoquinol methylase